MRPPVHTQRTGGRTGEVKLYGSGHRFPPVVAQHFDPVNLTCMNSSLCEVNLADGRRTKDNWYSKGLIYAI